MKFKDRYRVLVIGDPAYSEDPKRSLSNTGFGIATGKIIDALLQSGRFDIFHLPRGMQNHHAPSGDVPYRLYIPPYGDPNGWGYAGMICDWENPHLAIIESDPGSITEWRKNTQLRRIPNITHGPVEGAPLTRPWSDTMKEIVMTGGAVTLYTEFAKQAMLDGFGDYPENGRPLEVLGLGIDHAPFRKYTEAEREEARMKLGWTDRYVILNVARNAGRKMLPRLVYAMQKIRERIPNALLYLHTCVFENFYLGGHNLSEVVRLAGVKDCVQFPDFIRDAMRGIGYADDHKPSLIDLYNAADLFVSASGAEGWNLPMTEAAACGLPVCVPMYSGAWEVAQNFALGMKVVDFETHPSGAKMAVVTPQEIEANVSVLHDSPATAMAVVKQGIEFVKKLRWQPTTDRIVELALEMVEKKQ